MLQKRFILFFFLLSSFCCNAQNSHDTIPKESGYERAFIDNQMRVQTSLNKAIQPSGGMLGLGLRTTFSTFNDGSWGNNGIGTGGHFRLWFSKRINSEWFFDYIEQHQRNRVLRKDYHIGWSVMYYISDRHFSNFRPYVLAGHCFDYTRVTDQHDPDNFGKRWSGAVQAGLGTHYSLTYFLDLSLTAQYMIHLGSDLHAHIDGNNVEIENHKGINPEGHILITTSVNYKIAYLWRKK